MLVWMSDCLGYHMIMVISEGLLTLGRDLEKSQVPQRKPHSITTVDANVALRIQRNTKEVHRCGTCLNTRMVKAIPNKIG